MNAYPDYLPLPLREGYGLDKVNKIRSTGMDVGRAVQRWEFDDAPAFPTVGWTFTEPESRLFNAWVNQIAKAGWFTIRLVSDMGFDDVVARFAETPKRAELVGRYCWKYTAVLEIEFEPMLEPGWVDILPDYILFASIFDLAINRELPLDDIQVGILLIDEALNEEWPQA